MECSMLFEFIRYEGVDYCLSHKMDYVMLLRDDTFTPN